MSIAAPGQIMQIQQAVGLTKVREGRHHQVRPDLGKIGRLAATT